MRKRGGRIVAAAVAALVAAAPAAASGFSFFEQGAKASGQGGAWIARADDAAANWYNPAALVHVQGGEVQFGFNWLNIGSDTTFTLNDNTAVFVSELLGHPGVANGTTYDAVGNTATPAHFYYAQKIGRRWAFGLGLNNPFGLVSEWKDAPIVFSSRKAELRSYLVNPNAAYAIDDRWSIGFGVDYMSTEIRSFSRDAVLDVAPPDGFPDTVTRANLTGEGDSWGYNLGFQYKQKHFSVAANYRSAMSPTIDGELRFAGPLGNVLNSPGTAELDLPALGFLGAAWTSDRVDVELAGTWAQWSRFKELAIVTPNPATTTTLVEDWKSVWAYRLGVAVRLGASMSHEIRVGGLLDKSPVPVEHLRPSIPDSDRTGYTLGYGYNGKRWALDVYAMQLDFKTVTASGDFAQGVIDGTYKSSILLVGLTGKYRF